MVIGSGLQAHHRMRVIGLVGVVHRVGQGFVDGQDEVINPEGGALSVCSHF